MGILLSPASYAVLISLSTLIVTENTGMFGNEKSNNLISNLTILSVLV